MDLFPQAAPSKVAAGFPTNANIGDHFLEKKDWDFASGEDGGIWWGNDGQPPNSRWIKLGTWRRKNGKVTVERTEMPKGFSDSVQRRIYPIPPNAPKKIYLGTAPIGQPGGDSGNVSILGYPSTSYEEHAKQKVITSNTSNHTTIVTNAGGANANVYIGTVLHNVSNDTVMFYNTDDEEFKEIKFSTLSFVNNTSQTTAYRGPLTVPSTNKGEEGHRKGDFAINGDDFYICNTNYTDGTANIWVKITGVSNW